MRIRPPWILCFSMLLLSVQTTGCSTFSERHFFKSVDGNGKAINYYRVRVDGYTGLSSSRYLSGYFDEAAVDAYFNEIAQPARGAIFPKKKTATANAPTTSVPAPGAERVVSTDGDDGKSLVLILSSNADEIANQIGAFAENREMTATLGRLLNHDKVESSTKAAESLEDEKSRGQTIAQLGDGMVEAIKVADVTKSDVNENVLTFLDAVAREFGNTDSFKDLPEAHKWFNEHRDRLAAKE